MTSTLQLRRAAHADIPAVARLLLPSRSPRVGGVTLSRQTSAGALRLALTHVGLDTGGVWVVEDGGAVVSAAALLPPHGAVDDERPLLALRLELGLRTSSLAPRLSDGVPAEHWLLLVHQVSEPMLPALLSRVLLATESSALAVVFLGDCAPEMLLALGFILVQEGFPMLESKHCGKPSRSDSLLSAADFLVIITLRRSGPPFRMQQARLMEALGLTSGTVSVRLDRLERSGIVTREPDPTSARASLVQLTQRGVDLFDQVAPAHLANEDRLLSSAAPGWRFSSRPWRDDAPSESPCCAAMSG